MLLSEFDYALPESLIAKHPVQPRDQSRLLVVHKDPFRLEHRRFNEITDYAKLGDLFVGNNTKVLPARVQATRREKPLDILFLKHQQTSPLIWTAMCRNTKRMKIGEALAFPGNVIARLVKIADAQIHLEFSLDSSSFLDWLHTVGRPPLPPYIDRSTDETDTENYQTVFAKNLGAVAAPTAGLHFTPSLLEKIKKGGASFETITLHVGYGTFSPVRVNQISDHRMHEESYWVSDSTLQKIQTTKSRGEQVISIGTTSLRALESAVRWGPEGSTDLFITPGFQFQTATALLTNFHLPQSTLLILVSAFLGLERTRAAYQEAVSHQYRFFSYGDAMLILPT